MDDHAALRAHLCKRSYALTRYRLSLEGAHSVLRKIFLQDLEQVSVDTFCSEDLDVQSLGPCPGSPAGSLSEDLGRASM